MSLVPWRHAQVRGIVEDDKVLLAVEGDGKLKPGDSCVIQIRKPRNPKHNSLYWCLLSNITESTGRWPTPEALHKWLKFELGMYTITEVNDGRIAIEWDSTDFMSMGQEEFRDFFERAVALICLETGIDPTTMDRMNGQVDHPEDRQASRMA